MAACRSNSRWEAAARVYGQTRRERRLCEMRYGLLRRALPSIRAKKRYFGVLVKEYWFHQTTLKPKGLGLSWWGRWFLLTRARKGTVFGCFYSETSFLTSCFSCSARID